ncbi:MAG: AraC family transcriptional regulator [Bacteroidota bacterium]
MKPIYESITTHSNVSFKVESYEVSSNCETAGWHIHPEYELVYVKNGSGMLRIGNKIHSYTNGTLVFLSGNIPHSDFGNKQFDNGKEVVIQFSREFVERKLGQFPELTTIKRLIHSSKCVLIFDGTIKSHLSLQFEHFTELNPQEKLINLFSILNYLSAQENYIRLFNNDLLYEFREKESYRLRDIFQFLDTHYHQKISTREISEQIGLTPNSFSRFFKKMTNRTFVDFLNEFRVRKAIDVMNEGDTTITEAMYKSGFRSPSYFAKQFFKYQQMTPSTYLKKIKSL